jgi:hypothetical protein
MDSGSSLLLSWLSQQAIQHNAGCAQHSGKPDLKEVPELGQKQVRIASDFQK